MNSRQRPTLIVALIVFLVIAVFPPVHSEYIDFSGKMVWRVEQGFLFTSFYIAGHRELVLPPIAFAHLYFEWAIVLVVAAALLLFDLRQQS